MMTLEEMNKTMIYVVPAFNSNWKLMLEVEKMSLTELADMVNRSYEFPLLYSVEERDDKWVVTKRITQQTYNYIAEFDTEDEAVDYMYGSCLYGKMLDWDYYEDVNLAYNTLADMLEVSTATVISLVKWNEKFKKAILDKDFRFDYAHFRRTLTKDNPRKVDVERIIRKLNSELIYGGDFTKGWYNHFGEDIQGKKVEDVIEMIKERKY